LALVSFGLDSCVGVLSAAAIAWQFAGRDPEAREKVALRTVAVAFSKQTLLCTYLSAVLLVGLVLNALLGRPGGRFGDRWLRCPGGSGGLAG
jgi:hypothetical protein